MLQNSAEIAIFSQGYFLYFFLIAAHIWRFGVWKCGFGPWIGFLGVGFQLMGFEACGVAAYGFCGIRALCTNIEE